MSAGGNKSPAKKRGRAEADNQMTSQKPESRAGERKQRNLQAAINYPTTGSTGSPMGAIFNYFMRCRFFDQKLSFL